MDFEVTPAIARYAPRLLNRVSYRRKLCTKVLFWDVVDVHGDTLAPTNTSKAVNYLLSVICRKICSTTSVTNSGLMHVIPILMKCSLKKKPDLLHIVTAPVLRGSNERIRYPLMNQASEHGVPAAIVEKPIAVESEDWRQISELAERTKTKFVVNTQLNFHPQNLTLKQDVAEGKIGAIKFIEASARNPPVDQAPHVLQLVSSYIDNSRPAKVQGQISGAGQLDSAQPSPANATALVTYANGVQVSVAFWTRNGTPRTSRDRKQPP